MKRRAFFGFMGGVVAAGPKLAAGIADGAQSLNYIGPSISSGMVNEGPDASWKAKRIAELKAMIAGADPGIKQREKMDRLYAMEMQERFRLDSLRSVSPIHKHKMLIEGSRERNQRIRRADAEWDLHRLLTGN